MNVNVWQTVLSFTYNYTLINLQSIKEAKWTFIDTHKPFYTLAYTNIRHILILYRKITVQKYFSILTIVCQILQFHMF